MRIRSIKPEYWRSDDITVLPISTRLTFIGLWSYVDDNGVGADKLVSIVADLYADDFSRDPLETVKRVTEDLERLARGGQVVRYRAIHNERPKDLLYITRWKQHQVVNHPSLGHKYPLPPDETVQDAEHLTQPSGESLETLTHEQGNRGTGEGSGGTGEQRVPRKRGSRTKPQTHIVADYFPQPKTVQSIRAEFPQASSDDFEYQTRKFRDHWAKVGKPMADWDATWRNWIRTADERGELCRRNGAILSTADKRVAQAQALKLVVPDRMELE